MCSAVLEFLIVANLWILMSWQAVVCIDHPTSVGYESTLHRLRTDDAILLIVVELVEQLICHMARFVMQFSGHNIARELSRWCYCMCVGINTTLRGRCVKIG